jgi:hypothetical protein
MAQASKGSYLAIVLAVLALAPFCLGDLHEMADAAHAQGGVVGALIGELKREDDEAEVREIGDRAPPTRGEREEAHEQAEQVAIEADQGAAGGDQGSFAE